MTELRLEPVAKRRVLPQRERRPAERVGYVDSTAAIVGSSSPSQPSSSEFEVVPDEVDEDQHETRRTKPEEVTVHLLVCFLQFGLDLCLSQDSTDGCEVQTRVKRRKCTTYVAGMYQISAEDDGGTYKVRHHDQDWAMRNPSLAVLKAKKAFKYMRFDKTSGQLKSVISNATLAQYLGEALVSWRAARQSKHLRSLCAFPIRFRLRGIHSRFNRGKP